MPRFRATISFEEATNGEALARLGFVAPFLRAESALLRLDREGFHVVELSMADPETLPEPGVRFDAPSEPAPAV